MALAAHQAEQQAKMLSCNSSFISVNFLERILSTNFLGITSEAGDRSNPSLDNSLGALVVGCVGMGNRAAAEVDVGKFIAATELTG